MDSVDNITYSSIQQEESRIALCLIQDGKHKCIPICMTQYLNYNAMYSNYNASSMFVCAIV